MQQKQTVIGHEDTSDTRKMQEDGALCDAALDCATEGSGHPDFENWSAEFDRAIAERGYAPVPTHGEVVADRLLEIALTDYLNANECMRVVVDQVDKHHREKPARKLGAMKRLMQHDNLLTGKAHSASSAEAVVETDPEYHVFLEEGTRLSLLRMHLEAAERVASLRAEYLARTGELRKAQPR